jgi:EAL domain-containing protein (putative c-di-GMP-specific phosphodiesterase class I)
LPVDYVKIDGSFVRTLVDSPDDQVFVQALAEVARGFGKKTVAEFVEDERALNLLRSFGVDYAQGYFIGKPAPDRCRSRVLLSRIGLLREARRR